MVPRRGLEPPRPCERQHLKLVRLPIPPPGHRDRFGNRRRVEAAAIWRRARGRLSNAVGPRTAQRLRADERPQRTRHRARSPSSAAAASSAAMSARPCSRPAPGCASPSATRAAAWFLQPLGRRRPGLDHRRRPQPGPRSSRARSRAPTRSSTWSASSRAIFELIHVHGAGKLSPSRGQGAGRQAPSSSVSAIGADIDSAVRIWPDQGRRASRRSAPPSPRRPSSGRAWCSARRIISPTASRP